MPELTEEQAVKLQDGLEAATKSLDSAREGMAECNTKVDTLVKRQDALDKAGDTSEGERNAITKELKELSTQMQGLGDQYTNLLGQHRNGMKSLALSGRNENQSFTYRHPNSRGAIFESRRQAVELGMFFMATMQREGSARTHARQWLNEQKADLRYLPNIPQSFIRDMGNEWVQNMDKFTRGELAIQDLTGGATPGSILTRPEFSNTLIRNIEEHGVFRREALVWPMGSDTVYIPRRAGGFTVHWEGEAEAGTESDPDFQLLGMTAKKMMILHQWSSELDEDAVISLADIILFEMSLTIATEEDRIGFNGTGAGGDSPGFAGFVGLLGAPANATAATADSTGVPILITGAATNDLTTEVTQAKLRAMTGALHTWARGNAKWYMHRSVHADFDGIETTGGGPVVTYRDGETARIMGYPIMNVEGMPASPSAQSTNVFALGDLRKSWILGDRRAMSIQTSEHFAFNTDQLTIRTTSRVGFLMIQGNGMVVYKTGTTA